MPPRIPILTCLRATKPSPAFTLPFRPFSTSPSLLARVQSSVKKRKSYDPYAVALRNRKKAANVSRQAELKQQRIESLGDPVKGITTPFVASFETATPLEISEGAKLPKEDSRLNYGLKPEDVDRSLGRSRDLAVPRDPEPEAPSFGHSYFQRTAAKPSEPIDPLKADAEAAQRQKEAHETAATAIQRITALENASRKSKMKVNIARCVSVFGRHNTDRIFPPKAPGLTNVADPFSAPQRPDQNTADLQKRVGPDTGSSEVQIAILTAKINTLAQQLEKRGKGDKHNKRNLRLLVHRRQKLLQYLRRKERGGPRWQHCIETLGLTEGTWKGEISL
ncbi:hypothetical protein GQ43DRAFT_438050 [Delitschia confertaspora ATCC 74209]|uniref:Ribosomal protein S15 n=1 Tax=Delitschia confertaspora ATCC 74209 TaxID=1513339 RepID=A0A9P4MV51_9PLEO|nr:hypothetical protein GQ43DRAFT_438050 [Delitschia confertaspora ATCC 74209]